MTDEPGFGKETHSTYEPLPEEVAARRVTDPAAHTPSDSAGAPDVDTLEVIAVAQAHSFEQNERRIQAVRDLAATAREAETAKDELENYAQQVAADHYFARAEAAEADREGSAVSGERSPTHHVHAGTAREYPAMRRNPQSVALARRPSNVAADRPPPEPLNLTDEEWDSFIACLAPEDTAPAEYGGSHRDGVGR